MSRIGPRDTRTSMRAEDWRDSAACASEDTEMFFASALTAEGQANIRHAKVICWRCPSQLECGQWAIDNRVPFGVWGGVSEQERRKILRRRGVRLAEDPDAAEAKQAVA
ncbi:WhiB family transcriptional regulator [Streptomyces canus]|uniref:WhiB family transcriptional regulator n=1 Tax=Streptomyces canus TaxID=58343 RepID=UPI0036A95EFD